MSKLITSKFGVTLLKASQIAQKAIEGADVTCRDENTRVFVFAAFNNFNETRVRVRRFQKMIVRVLSSLVTCRNMHVILRSLKIRIV